jgi:hypothetical protein
MSLTQLKAAPTDAQTINNVGDTLNAIQQQAGSDGGQNGNGSGLLQKINQIMNPSVNSPPSSNSAGQSSSATPPAAAPVSPTGSTAPDANQDD